MTSMHALGVPGRRDLRMAYRISRARYAQLYGPTTGDRVRLADTELLAKVEADATVYGDEAVFGGGKTMREGMAVPR